MGFPCRTPDPHLQLHLPTQEEALHASVSREIAHGGGGAGHVGFFTSGGGGVNRTPQSWGGGGFAQRAQLTGTINQSL